MAQAAVTYGGQIIRITNFSQPRFHYKSGLLMGFFFGNDKYTYAYPADFRIEDQDQNNALGGYYVESAFLDYSVKKISREELSTHKLPDSQVVLAVNGDIINSHIFYLVSPYTDFCKYANYTWTYDQNNLPLDSHGNIIFPSGTPQTVPVSLNTNALAFYHKNINLITSSDYTDDKDLGVYNLALCAMKIDMINRDIFPLFNQSPELVGYVATQNGEWSTGTIFNQPTLADIQQYLLNLENFYVAAYSNQVLIADALADTKIFWLANVLSQSGISVFSVEDKIKILTLAIETQMVSSKLNDAEFMLKVVSSVSLVPAQVDDFLSQLISTKFYDMNNVEQTLFEAIYLNVADNRPGRYTFGLYNIPNDRKTYIETLYNLWLLSKYNPYFDSPSYAQPADDLGVFPESYFMTTSGKANYDLNTAPSVLVYSTSDNFLSSYSTTYTFSIQNEIVNVKKLDVFNSIDDFPTQYGAYHLFQPVAILGYKADLDLAIPGNGCIPIFYLYYVDDYKDTKELDAIILLIRDVVLSYELFADASTKIGYIRNLVQLKDLSDAERVVLIWEAVKGVSGTIQITAGMVASISAFIQQTTTDPDIAVFTQKLNLFLFVLTISCALSDIATKRRLIVAADGVIDAQRNLIAAGKSVNISSDVMNMITAIDNNKPVLINLMESKISNLEISGLSTKFDALDADTQIDFFRNFYNLNDQKAWNNLNSLKPINGSTTNTYNLIDIWANDIKSEIQLKGNIAFLDSYGYMIYKEKDVWEHLDQIKDSPGYNRTNFNPIGGHTESNFIDISSESDLNSSTTPFFIKFDPNTPGLPSTGNNPMNNYHFDDTNPKGHIIHYNLFKENPNLVANGKNPYEFGGKVFTRIEKKTEINPNWSTDKIKEEHAFALSNKKQSRVDPPAPPRYGQTDPYQITWYEGTFTDGTVVKIKHANYEWQNGKLYTDYICYFEIQR